MNETTVAAAPPSDERTTPRRGPREAVRLAIAAVLGSALTLAATTGINAMRTNTAATQSPQQGTQLRDEMLLTSHSLAATSGLRDEMLLTWHEGSVTPPSGASVVWHAADAQR